RADRGLRELSNAEHELGSAIDEDVHACIAKSRRAHDEEITSALELHALERRDVDALAENDRLAVLDKAMTGDRRVRFDRFQSDEAAAAQHRCVAPAVIALDVASMKNLTAAIARALRFQK